MAVTRRDVESEVVGQRMTLDEFLALPEIKPALEYGGGVVSQRIAADGQRAVLRVSFATEVSVFSEPRRLAVALPGLRTTYGGASWVPDISVYTWSRIPREPNGRVANRFTEPPDIAVEIVSRDQTATNLVSKCIWYVKNGVKIALIADPAEDIVLRFRPDALPEALTGDDRIDLDEVLPGFELTVSQLFGSLVLD
jgi:Uma2 family endonuclease